MNQSKSYTLPEVFNNTRMGFILEFYSSKSSDFIVKELSELTIKNITLTNEFYREPSHSNAILIKEYEGKKPRYSLHLAQQEFNSILPIIKNALKWISETSETTNDTVMKVNMSFDHSHLRTPYSISDMVPQKLIVKFNEDYIYNRFPQQKNSPYAVSIKQLIPLNESLYTNDLVKNINYTIGIPTKNYFGINFNEQTQGVIQFNYIGGANYAYKEKEIVELLEYYTIKTFQSLNERDYSDNELKDLRKLTDKFYKIQEAYYDPAIFTDQYPDIKIAVNLRRDTQLLKSFWPKMRNFIFEMVINNQMLKGEINYDTDFGRYQVRSADLNCSRLHDVDVVKCNIKGIVENCSLWSCDVKSSRISKSVLIKGNEIKESYLNAVSAERPNVIEKCFVENNNEFIDCTIKESVIKFAGIGKSATLDESTVIIGRETRQPVAKGVEVEEIRDYKWLQKLSGKQPNSSKFGNEYVKKPFI
jgi:hypothetical protein